MSTHLRLVRPRHKNRSVPARPPNAELWTREYLTPSEVEKLMKEARQGRRGHRDATLILTAFRHRLRASEICDLEWSQVEFGWSAAPCPPGQERQAAVHPLRGNEI
jgi:type 1 fimbriae regulatory protein FimB/type 1 fimbriae regulatory protein FimE